MSSGTPWPSRAGSALELPRGRGRPGPRDRSRSRCCSRRSAATLRPRPFLLDRARARRAAARRAGRARGPARGRRDRVRVRGAAPERAQLEAAGDRRSPGAPVRCRGRPSADGRGGRRPGRATATRSSPSTSTRWVVPPGSRRWTSPGSSVGSISTRRRRVRLGGADAVDALLDRGATFTAAEMLGSASRALDMAVEYAKDRVQFGRPIGSFQAVKHRCADMLVDVEGMRSTAYWAAWCIGDDDPTPRSRRRRPRSGAPTPRSG